MHCSDNVGTKKLVFDAITSMHPANVDIFVQKPLISSCTKIETTNTANGKTGYMWVLEVLSLRDCCTYIFRKYN
jgi:hypothetical protein